MKKPINTRKGRGRPIGTDVARAMSYMRKFCGAGPGRPRDPDKPRCACGEMTLIRALRRGHDCGNWGGER